MTNDFDLARLREQHLYDGLEEDLCVGEELQLPGPAGRIEALTSYPSNFSSGAPIAIICHPHPLYGGSMANKVVHMLSDVFNELGVPTLRFNFRGVGKSDGCFEQGVGETEDLLAVVRWFRERHPGSPVWLSGFSFGAYVVMRAQPLAEAERLLLVAPPVTLFDFQSLPPVEVPWMIIQGGRDEIISPQAVSAWVHKQSNRPLYRWMADADHFFHGRMNRLRDSIIKVWDTSQSTAHTS